MRKAAAAAPATVANVSCGFDVLGFALMQPVDEVEVRWSARKGITIAAIEGDNGKLPQDPGRNTAGIAAQAILRAAQVKQGIELRLKKGVPISSGMGSSAASAVASVVALQTLLGTDFETNELLTFAAQGEAVTSGTPHLDNVTPCLLGGFTAVRSPAPVEVFTIPYPKGLLGTVVHPHLTVNTRAARELLPKTLPLATAVSQWGNVAGLVTALTTGDYDLLRRSFHDVVAEPVRKVLIPGFDQVKEAALTAGALGCSISGSGPSIFALSPTKHSAEKVAAVMQAAFQKAGQRSTAYVTPINPRGCQTTT